MKNLLLTALLAANVHFRPKATTCIDRDAWHAGSKQPGPFWLVNIPAKPLSTLIASVIVVSMATGCATSPRSLSIREGAVHVGGRYILDGGLDVVACEVFRSHKESCLFPMGVGRNTVREIRGAVVLDVLRIRSVGAIDADYTYIYVTAQPDGGTYVINEIYLPLFMKRWHPVAE